MFLRGRDVQRANWVLTCPNFYPFYLSASFPLSDWVMTECGPLEKGMANQFSVLALRTP